MASDQKTDPLIDLCIDILMGGLSCALSRTVSAPFERVKMLIQNQDELIRFGHLDKPYTGIIDCFGRVIASEGILALWQGNLINIARFFPTHILNLILKDKFRRFVGINKNTDGYWTRFAKNIISGSLSAVTSLLFVYSFDYMYTRLACNIMEGGTHQFNGYTDLCLKTFQSDGIRGFYRGYILSCFGVFLYRGLYFGLYDLLKPFGQNNFYSSFTLGWFITISVGLITYPLDTIRRRMMMTSCEPVKYQTSLHATSEITKKNGFTSLFQGAVANIIRGVLGAAALAAYDRIEASIWIR